VSTFVGFARSEGYRLDNRYVHGVTYTNQLVAHRYDVAVATILRVTPPLSNMLDGWDRRGTPPTTCDRSAESANRHLWQ